MQNILKLVFLIALAISIPAVAQTEVESEQGFSQGTPENPGGTAEIESEEPQPAAPAPTEDPEAPHKDGESKPFFDWSKHKDEKKVQHPLAEKGLIKITKEGTYIYKVPLSNQTKAFNLHVGFFDPPNLKNPDSDDYDATFSANYSANASPLVMLDYEWQIWRIGVGKIGLTAGLGIFTSQGHGHFAHPSLNPGLTPLETFTFLAMPVTVGAVYRLHIWDRQLFVPFGSGGIEGIPFTEIRDDNKGPKFGGSAAAYAAAGVGINLTYFDRFAALALDREYGINRVYLMGEFRQFFALSPHYDFSGTYINGGLTMEF